MDIAEIKMLEKEYGLPLYIFDEEEFKKNYLNLLNTFRAIYPKYNIAYSYKTNYTPRICKLVKELGGLAEVVSEMEYQLAKKIGYKNEDIIFNGPVKGNALSEHLLSNGTINIDSLDELSRVIDLSKENRDKTLHIVFRVNIDIGQSFISRFGLDAYEDNSKKSELDTAFELISDYPNIVVDGLHCHVGRSRNIDAWKNRVRVMFSLVDRYFDKPPKFIDFGSGMNSVMEESLAAQFGNSIPTFQEYANVLAIAMNKKYGHLAEEDKPYLYTEPGTTVVSGFMSFIGKVESIKNVKGKTYITFNCSYGNLSELATQKRLPITVFHNSDENEKYENATFVGYTCLEHDHIYEGYNGEMSVGDYVEFRNVGSYSNVFKPPFILPNCAMVSKDSQNKYKIIKEAENFEYIFKIYFLRSDRSGRV